MPSASKSVRACPALVGGVHPPQATRRRVGTAHRWSLARGLAGDLGSARAHRRVLLLLQVDVLGAGRGHGRRVSRRDVRAPTVLQRGLRVARLALPRQQPVHEHRGRIGMRGVVEDRYRPEAGIGGATSRRSTPSTLVPSPSLRKFSSTAVVIPSPIGYRPRTTNSTPWRGSRVSAMSCSSISRLRKPSPRSCKMMVAVLT